MFLTQYLVARGVHDDKKSTPAIELFKLPKRIVHAMYCS